MVFCAKIVNGYNYYSYKPVTIFVRKLHMHIFLISGISPSKEKNDLDNQSHDLEQSIQEWTNLWKTAFKKFEPVWSAWSRPGPFNF